MSASATQGGHNEHRSMMAMVRSLRASAFDKNIHRTSYDFLFTFYINCFLLVLCPRYGESLVFVSHRNFTKIIGYRILSFGFGICHFGCKVWRHLCAYVYSLVNNCKRFCWQNLHLLANLGDVFMVLN